MTCSYRPDGHPGTVWRFLVNRAAQECLDDPESNTVKTKTERAPKRRPLGWRRIAPSSSEDCDVLVSLHAGDRRNPLVP